MDYLEIEGYKSINYQRVDFAPINILIGANGSGKSNLLSFFDFLNRLYEQKLNEYIELSGGQSKTFHKGLKTTDKIKFRIEFDNGENGYAVSLKAGTDSLVFLSERLAYRGDIGKDISLSGRESILKNTDNYRAKYIIKYLTKFRKYHFYDTSEKSPFTELSHVENDSYFLYGDGSNIASYLFYILESHKKVYTRIRKTIQSIAPYFSDFYFKVNRNGLIRLQWTDKFSDIIYGPSDLSDGTLRFIALTVLFMQPDLPDTIIIDEPELGLHPAAISKLAGMIKSAAAKRSQVILATQSTDLLSHFTPEDIIAVDQVNGESHFKRLDSDSLKSWLDEYTIDDLWKRNIITSGQPNYNAG